MSKNETKYQRSSFCLRIWSRVLNFKKKVMSFLNEILGSGVTNNKNSPIEDEFYDPFVNDIERKILEDNGANNTRFNSSKSKLQGEWSNYIYELWPSLEKIISNENEQQFISWINVNINGRTAAELNELNRLFSEKVFLNNRFSLARVEWIALTYQKHNCKKLFESFVRDAHLVSLSALKRCLEMGTKPDGDAVGLYHLREFDKLKLLASYGANLNVLFESRRISIFQIDDGDVFILSNKYYVPVDLLGLSLAEVIKKIGPQDIKDYLKKNYNLC